MKKLISMVLTAAMVASLVPATAFAGSNDIKGTAKPTNVVTIAKEDAAKNMPIVDNDGVDPELKITLDNVDVFKNSTTSNASFTVELSLDNAEWDAAVNTNKLDINQLIHVWDGEGDVVVSGVTVDKPATELEDDYAKIKFLVDVDRSNLSKGDYITITLDTILTKASKGTLATVTVDGVAEADDLVFASVEGRGIVAETRKVATVAEEEWITLDKDLKIKSTVGNFVGTQKFELKLSKGFEFYNVNSKAGVYTFGTPDDNVVELTYLGSSDEFTIDAADIEIEATTAKADTTCVMTVRAIDNGNTGEFSAKATVEVMKVVDYVVILEVDEDEDVPVYYSGVNSENYGLTDDGDHWSLEVTARETFPGAWSMRKGFNFELPAGVYVVDYELVDHENFYLNKANASDANVNDAFWDAYQDGDHVKFEFAKRVFDDVDNDLRNKKCATMTFKLQVVADPGFVGPVVLKLTGDLVDEQEVTIAEFATPYIVKAEQNDLKIDYRDTPIYTDIVITEAEAGLWAKDEAVFNLNLEKTNTTFLAFEDAEVTVDDASGLEISDDVTDGTIIVEVDKESDEPAVVTISDITLFMSRSIPAGPYDLTGETTLGNAYMGEVLFAADEAGNTYQDKNITGNYGDTLDISGDNDVDFYSDRSSVDTVEEDSYVGDVCDFEDTVKEAFVNVVTAGREQDDNSFTTVVKVPVGENVLYAGEVTVELDVPAYINANGYTMLPVRAVAKALGINNNNVLWDQATKTVTILYGQRIITMQVGASVVYVNGSAIPASSSVEIVDGRTFLGLRDLATALGVTTIDWDAASKTALLNAEFEA